MALFGDYMVASSVMGYTDGGLECGVMKLLKYWKL